MMFGLLLDRVWLLDPLHLIIKVVTRIVKTICGHIPLLSLLVWLKLPSDHDTLLKELVPRNHSILMLVLGFQYLDRWL